MLIILINNKKKNCYKSQLIKYIIFSNKLSLSCNILNAPSEKTMFLWNFYHLFRVLLYPRGRETLVLIAGVQKKSQDQGVPPMPPLGETLFYEVSLSQSCSLLI